MTILETLLDAFQTGPCDFCAASGDCRPKRVYRDPETGCFYCLPCLEAACTPLEDGPEDAEVVAFGRAVLDELLPRAEGQEEIAAERMDMALIACHSRQIAA